MEKKGILLINDAYNANPESMKAALSNLPVPKEGKKTIAVLGSMKELGSFSEVAHRNIGSFAADRIDHLLTFGEETQNLCFSFQEKNKPAEFFLDIEVLKGRLKELAEPGDVVLIKGSRSMQLERVLECFY
jgi:UDP-N-acetylmuramoyl-tripeptide--D-alanyl-D-alanine ligase